MVSTSISVRWPKGETIAVGTIAIDACEQVIGITNASQPQRIILKGVEGNIGERIDGFQMAAVAIEMVKLGAIFSNMRCAQMVLSIETNSHVR